MEWYILVPHRWQHERDIGRAFLDRFDSGIDPNGNAFIAGELDLCSEHGHHYLTLQIRVEYPARFPEMNLTPSVYLLSHRDEWENEGDSHIESD